MIECNIGIMNYRQDIENIRGWLLQGLISYEDAFIMAKPIIDKMNKFSKEIAKKHNVRPRKITFASLMR
jgi:hypothetical protein